MQCAYLTRTIWFAFCIKSHQQKHSLHPFTVHPFAANPVLCIPNKALLNQQHSKSIQQHSTQSSRVFVSFKHIFALFFSSCFLKYQPGMFCLSEFEFKLFGMFRLESNRDPIRNQSSSSSQSQQQVGEMLNDICHFVFCQLFW